MPKELFDQPLTTLPDADDRLTLSQPDVEGGKNLKWSVLYSLFPVPYFDATVGTTGADYTTIADAKTAGKNRIKLITNISESFTISDYTLIDCNGYAITGNVTISGSNLTFRDLNIVGTLNVTGDYNIIETCKTTNITIDATADYSIIRNTSATGTVTDNSTTTIELDTY